MQTLIRYLRLCRASTASATICLVLTPFMAGFYDVFSALILGVLALLLHWFSFAENSLHDYIIGADKKDPSKQHHPLLTGEISLRDAINFVHWSTPILAIIAVVVTFWLSPNPFWALVWFFMAYVWGSAYNLGLSKSSSLGVLPISITFASLGAWAWLLSHPSMGLIGSVSVGYVFFTILFQIGVSGGLKDMRMKERSNLLTIFGARLRRFKGKSYFDPGDSIYYGYGMKFINLFLGGVLLYLVFSWQGLISLLFFGSIALYYLHQLTKYRIYNHNRELLNMSLMEVATIFLPILILVPLVPAIALMTFGVVYFFGANLILWGKSYPKV